MTGKLFCGMTFSLKNPRKKADNKDEDFLLPPLQGPLPSQTHRGHQHLHCGDLRLHRKGFRRGIHFLPVLYPLRFVRGPSLGNTFLPGLVGRPPSQCGQHLHCQRPRIALRDGKLLQQCADSPGKGRACGKNGFPEDDSSVGAKLSSS